MAQKAVPNHSVSIRLACQEFSISETCYRYQPFLNSENEEIADMLVDLTKNESNWGFGMCFDYLRNIKGSK
jgi:putative transposase